MRQRSRERERREGREYYLVNQRWEGEVRRWKREEKRRWRSSKSGEGKREGNREGGW